MAGRSARLLGVIVAAVLLVASPASAADEIGLSRDGVTWSSGLQQPLFDPARRWVPGDQRTATFYVRNQGPSAATLTLEARSADEDVLLANDGIGLRARVDGGPWQPLRNGAPTLRLTGRDIPATGAVTVEVGATFDPASTNRSQQRDLALEVVVTLTESLAHRGDPGDLPGAGSTVPERFVVAGVVLICLGAVLLACRHGRAVGGG